jgi:alpha-N-arabinofuranosidase
MRTLLTCALLVLFELTPRAASSAATPPPVETIIHTQPLHSGRIDPKLFGNFIELLDDVVPGMWAELLGDRSFEGVLPAANWCYYDGSLDICDRTWETNATWTLDTERPFNGARAARLEPKGDSARLSQAGLSVKKGMKYLFSGHFRAEPGLKASVSLKFLLPTGDWLTLASADLTPQSEQWQKCTSQLVSSGETDQAVFELRVEGTGRLWADKLSLMPADAQLGWRRDVVDAIKEVRPSVLRWGGSTVDPGNYRWKNGIGDRDLRVPWRNENWGRLDPNDVGIDEFCQFCELVSAEPLICVSFSDGPEGAAHLVQYCNGSADTAWGRKRVEHGHPVPYHVKYWQVGNEINGNDPVYLDRIAAFIGAMKQSDPDALVLTSFPTQRLLDRVGKDIAFVCPHHYTTDLAECDRDFERIVHMISHTPGCEHIQIGVTEWNIDAGAWGLGRAKQQTLEAALLNARYLQLMMRHSDRVKIACRSNLANSFCGAIIETAPSGAGVLKRPSYYVMELYAHHFKPLPLWLEQFSDRIDLFASGSEDGREIVVFGVNPSREPLELKLGFQGFARSIRVDKAEALCDVEDRGQPDVMNHWRTPERVAIKSVSPAANTVIVPRLSAIAIECVMN